MPTSPLPLLRVWSFYHPPSQGTGSSLGGPHHFPTPTALLAREAWGNREYYCKFYIRSSPQLPAQRGTDDRYHQGAHR